MAAALGPGTLALILLPSILMYGFEAYGWRLTLGRYAGIVPFWKLFLIRTAGEAVNLTTPSAYVGGEPVKAFLVKRQGIPLVDGLASVVLAKTTLTASQIVFILLGVGLGLWVLGNRGEGGVGSAVVLASVLGVGLLLFGTILFVALQRRGLFFGLLTLLRRCGLRLAALEAREEKLRELDQTILSFYQSHRSAFLASTGVSFLGWLAEALEVYMMLYVLVGPPGLSTAVAVAALSVFVKGTTFVIPGSLGAQEGANLLLVVAFGYSDVAGMSFALLRRLREMVWIGIGLLGLAVMGQGGNAGPDDVSPRQEVI